MFLIHYILYGIGGIGLPSFQWKFKGDGKNRAVFIDDPPKMIVRYPLEREELTLKLKVSLLNMQDLFFLISNVLNTICLTAPQSIS